MSATFTKHFGENKKGFNDKKNPPTQVLALGADSEVSLSGAGPKGEVLAVKALDSRVCIVHERTGGKGEAHWRRFVITGLKKGKTMVEARMPTADGTVLCYLVVEVTGSIHHHRLVFFPGERKLGSTVLGTIYVIGGNGEHYSAAGGEEKGRTRPGDGGHTVDPTPAGHYTLGPKRHVVTTSWINSSIPWGASLRINADDEVEYAGDDNIWHMATGKNGVVTKAIIAFDAKNHEHTTFEEANDEARERFINKSGKLKSTTWKKNDFGMWGWNLRRKGTMTAYYIHTTPGNEKKPGSRLDNSHGCIHVIPKERDEMINNGYLKEGVEFEVRPYSEKGPPG